MSKALSAKPAFIKPYYIEVLKEEGLTAKDLAESLGVPLDHIHRKIKRGWIGDNNLIFKATSFDGLNKNNGLTFETYAFDIVSAKAFVARWKNERGDSYLQFLFRCERVVMEEIPKMQSRIKELERNEQIRIESEMAKKLRSETRRGIIPTYTSPLFAAFDEARGLLQKTLALPKSMLTESEIATNERIHCSHRLRGVSEELDRRERYERAILAWEKLSPEQRAAIPRPERSSFGLR